MSACREFRVSVRCFARLFGEEPSDNDEPTRITLMRFYDHPGISWFSMKLAIATRLQVEVYSLWNIIAGDCFVSLKSCLMVSVELSMPYFFFPLGGRKTPQGEENPLKIGWKPFLRPPRGRETSSYIRDGLKNIYNF